MLVGCNSDFELIAVKGFDAGTGVRSVDWALLVMFVKGSFRDRLAATVGLSALGCRLSLGSARASSRVLIRALSSGITNDLAKRLVGIATFDVSFFCCDVA